MGAYCAATALLLIGAGSILALAQGMERLRLVGQLNSWVPGTFSVIGLLWLSSAVSVIVLAYRLRARILAAAAAASFSATTALIYVWASIISFSGAGTWDVLRHVTVGGVYPLAAVLVLVGGGALLTFVRAGSVPRGSAA